MERILLSVKLIGGKFRLNKRRHFFTLNTFSVWNVLPQHVVLASSLDGCKRGLDTFHEEQVYQWLLVMLSICYLQEQRQCASKNQLLGSNEREKVIFCLWAFQRLLVGYRQKQDAELCGTLVWFNRVLVLWEDQFKDLHTTIFKRLNQFLRSCDCLLS